MKIIYVLVFVLFPFVLNAQIFELLIYTKGNCGRCKAVKEYLIKNEINFQECVVSNDTCMNEMWEKLEKINIETQVIPPIILINEVIIFPVYENGLMTPVKINEFLDKILLLYYESTPLPYTYAGQDIRILNEIYDYKKTDYLNDIDIIDVSNKTERFYVIAVCFGNAKYAVSKKEKYISSGYSNSKILKFENSYRVSIIDFDQKSKAKKYIKNNKLKAWIYEF